jgi:antitoxin HicB
MLRYTIVLTPESDGSAINVTVPAMPGVLTWGATREEALTSAREAIELHLEGYVERGRPFPRDRRPQGKQFITIDVRPPIGATRRSA